jgi:GTP-binding protein
MIPADSQDIRAEYNILIGELKKYNPELLDKKRLLAISKSDLLDDELQRELEKELPEGIPAVFISALTHRGIADLKDLIWQQLQG